MGQRIAVTVGQTAEIGAISAAETRVMTAKKLLNPAVIEPEEGGDTPEGNRFHGFVEGDEVEHIRGDFKFSVGASFQDIPAKIVICEKVLILELEGAGDAFDEGQGEFQGVVFLFPPPLHFARHFFQRGEAGESSFPRE